MIALFPAAWWVLIFLGLILLVLMADTVRVYWGAMNDLERDDIPDL